jgi:hypothetical protein
MVQFDRAQLSLTAAVTLIVSCIIVSELGVKLNKGKIFNPMYLIISNTIEQTQVSSVASYLHESVNVRC